MLPPIPAPPRGHNNLRTSGDRSSCTARLPPGRAAHWSPPVPLCYSSPPARRKKKPAPTMAAPAAANALEGQVDIVAWAGYIERGETDKSYDWVTQFEKDTGCKVNVKVAGTSDEMVSLMTQGGYDLVTASGDASLRLIRGGTVQPVDVTKRGQLQQRRQAPAGSGVALRGRQALRRAVPVGPERAHVQHEGVQEAADFVVRGVRAAEAAGRQAEQGSRAGATRAPSTSPMRRSI